MKACAVWRDEKNTFLVKKTETRIKGGTRRREDYKTKIGPNLTSKSDTKIKVREQTNN